MKRKLSVLLTVIVAATILTVPALAKKNRPEKADGIWCYSPRVTDIRPILLDVNYTPREKMFLSATYDSVWSGTFTGHSKDTGLVVSHIPRGMPPPIPMSFVGTVWFDSANIGGKSGGLEMDVLGDRADPTSDWRGTWVITGGTDDLADLRGNGDWWGPGWQEDPNECGVIYYSVEELDDIDSDDDDDD